MIHRNPWCKLSEVRQLQEKMFKSVLRHAYENTVFYRRLYRSHGVTPDDITSLDDIRKLPIISKQDLRQCLLRERFSRKYHIRRCSESRTSGSTGEPFKVYLEKHALNYLWALHFRRLLIYGYRPWYTLVVFGPYWAAGLPTFKTRGVRLGIRNMSDFDFNRLSLSDDPFDNTSYLRRIQPEVIWCPSSYMRLLIQATREIGLDDVRPRIIICGAEMLDAPTRSLIEKTFHRKVFDEYGTVDVASRAIAWQCELHKGYHINSDSVYLEFIKDGEHVSDGEEGHVVATNLFRYATPAIRYDIGDIGTPSEEPCPCGRSFPMMESIHGRSDDCLLMPDGRRISPFSVMSVLQDISGIRRYQVIQEATAKIVTYIDPSSDRSSVEEEARKKLGNLLGAGVRVELVLGPILHEKGKKYRAVKSTLSHKF